MNKAGVAVRQDGSRRSLFSLLGQSEIAPELVLSLDEIVSKADPVIRQQVAADALYAQYADRQARDAEQLRKEEAAIIPETFDYDALSGLSNELKQKLNKQKPVNVAEAGRIEGMTPAALTLILAVIRSGERRSA